MLLISYTQKCFNTSIRVLPNQVWKLLIALFKVPNTGAFTVHVQRCQVFLFCSIYYLVLFSSCKYLWFEQNASKYLFSRITLCTLLWKQMKNTVYQAKILFFLLKTTFCFRKRLTSLYVVCRYQAKFFFFFFSGATFHIPFTKSATLNRLLHCSLWQFSGAIFLFSRALFAFRGRNRPEPPCNFFPGRYLL